MVVGEVLGKVCVLMLTHKSLEQYFNYFKENCNINFYIHVDLKSDFHQISIPFLGLKNIFFIEERVDVKWAGFSMVQATINLIKFALDHDKDNEYFHLISGDDVILTKNLIWNDRAIYMECRVSVPHRYRMRFIAPHADTSYQRSFLGKVLTQLYKVLDKLFLTQAKSYFGSQWFSIRRQQLQQMVSSITQDDIAFFRKRLCPDEHFFQYLIEKNTLLNHISPIGNKRFIVFDINYQRGSSPIFLDGDQLTTAQKQNYWFARKVEKNIMLQFYDLNK